MTRDCCICPPGEKICNLFAKSVFTDTLWKSYGITVILKENSAGISIFCQTFYPVISLSKNYPGCQPHYKIKGCKPDRNPLVTVCFRFF